MSRRYKVVFITIVPSPYQRDLFGAMAARHDLDLKVFYLEQASPDSPWPPKGLRPFERVLPGFWVPIAGARWHVNWGLRDVVHADFVVLSSLTSWTGQWLMRCGLRGKRWIFWGERLRQQVDARRDFVQRKLVAPLRRAAGIVAVGCDAENDYRRRFPGARHFCIPYHCDLSAFFSCADRQENGGPLVFFFCGQMIRRKGVDLLLGAFDRLVGRGLNVRLLLVGREAELPQLLLAVSGAARDRIQYEGFQPPERLPEHFAKADVFVLPSRHDGWGVVVNQALGAGLPVICSDAVGAGSDLVEEGVNGLRFAAGDGEGLGRCLERLAASLATAREWGRKSAQKARAIVPEAGAEKWLKVFDQLSDAP